MKLTTPILFIFFNNPNTTRLVFDRIKDAQPTKLFLFCDGIRKGNESSDGITKELKREIYDKVNWHCEVFTFFPDINYGPAQGVYKAINWFFDNVEEGIILEHDTLPHPDFFLYCATLLEKYRHEKKIGLISGSCFYDFNSSLDSSYGFNYFPHIWGWATWKRAIIDYTSSPKATDSEIRQLIKNRILISKNLKFYVRYMFFLNRRNLIETWDLQLMFALWSNGMCSIFPTKNLISNIGFGPDALHCTDPNHSLSNIPVQSILPLRHPTSIKFDNNYDLLYYQRHINKSPFRLLLSIVRHYIMYFKKKHFLKSIFYL
jgi:hypothetical protein